MRNTYGLASVPNVLVTMITTRDEDDRLMVNDSGEKIPVDKFEQRIHTFNRHRIGKNITGHADESPELPVIFPVA